MRQRRRQQQRAAAASEPNHAFGASWQAVCLPVEMVVAEPVVVDPGSEVAAAMALVALMVPGVEAMGQADLA